MDWLRLLRTVRHLRPIQVVDRVRRKLRPARFQPVSAGPLRPINGVWRTPAARPRSLNEQGEIVVFGEAYPVARENDWNADLPPLVLYNLHYFDDLAAEEASRRTDAQCELINRWIDQNPSGRGTGWDPYPLSLRIVNWIKWHLAHSTENGLNTHQLDSLATQAQAVLEQLEYHLLGNHLLANAKALVFAGSFFEGKQAKVWLEKGLDIFRAELPEQILSDGGHFELSPMYHCIILEDVLDLINLQSTFPDLPIDRRLGGLNRWATSMFRWLWAMTHPDGQVSFFNDAAINIAIPPDALDRYRHRLDVPAAAQPADGLIYLADSGYIRLQHQDVVAILDVAEVGPAYQPGHAHADTLSFELSAGTQRCLVNSGTSLYGLSAERERQRSTSAHTTVEVDGQNSSEVWSGFRVARRAHPGIPQIDQDSNRLRVSCTHDGYRRLPGQVTHRRTWELLRQDRPELRIEDELEGRFESALARYYLEPGFTVATRDGDDPSGEFIVSAADSTAHSLQLRFNHGNVRCIPTTYHPRFGESLANSCIESRFLTPAQTLQIGWSNEQ